MQQDIQATVQFARSLSASQVVLSSTGSRHGVETVITANGDGGASFIAGNAGRGLGTSVLIATAPFPVARPLSTEDAAALSYPYVAVKMTCGLSVARDGLDGLPKAAIVLVSGADVFAVWRLSKPVQHAKALEIGRKLAERLGGEFTSFVPLVGTSRRGQPVRQVWNLKGHGHDPDSLLTQLDGEVETPLVRADQMTVKPKDWIWPDMIAAGMFVLVMGPPKVGKSTILMDLAARLTRGWAWPDGKPGSVPGGVVFFENEDDEDDTLARAEAAGADPSRMIISKPVRDLSSAEKVAQLERDLNKLDNPRMIVLSPVRMYFGAKEGRGQQDVRKRLEPLLNMATRRKIAIVGNGHKQAGKNGRSAEDAAGPQAFAQRARNVLLVTIDETDPAFARNPKLARRLLTSAGANNTSDTFGLPYKIVSAQSKDGIATSRIHWLDRSEMEVVEPVRLALPSPRPLAADWLMELLADGKPRLESEVVEAATGLYGRSTLYNAAKAIGVTYGKSSYQGPSTWRLELANSGILS